MKIKIISLFAALLCTAAFVGCVLTPPVQQGIYTAGYTYAEVVASKTPALEPTLLDVATKLPKLADGSMSPQDYGAFSAELKALKLGTVAVTPPAGQVDQFNTFNAFLSSIIGNLAQASKGGVVSPVQGLAISDLMTASNGITAGDQFYHGTQQPLPGT